MTRINCVPAEELHSKHLIAEYREIARVPSLAYVAFLRGEKPSDPRNPASYVLGTGHVRFFYSRLGYIAKRFRQLVSEMQYRGYSPNYTELPSIYFTRIPLSWQNDWEPTTQAIALNRARIAARMPKKSCA